MFFRNWEKQVHHRDTEKRGEKSCSGGSHFSLFGLVDGDAARINAQVAKKSRSLAFAARSPGMTNVKSKFEGIGIYRAGAGWLGATI